MKKIIISTLLCSLAFPLVAQSNTALEKKLLLDNQNLRAKLENTVSNNLNDMLFSANYLPPRKRSGEVANESIIFNISGLWYDPAMDGLGFNIIHASNGIFIYYYGYTQDGKRLWLVSDVGPINLIKSQTYTLDLFEGAPSNGANFVTKPTLGNGVAKWGTLTMSIDSCTAGTMTLVGKDGQKIFNITKLGDIKAMACSVSNDDGTGTDGGDGTGGGDLENPWRLVWSDEFDGSSVDATRWTVLNNSTYGAGNNELACLMNRPENIKVQDGRLLITALREKSPIACEKTTRSYTSAHMNTKGTFSATYGRFEIRAKVPLEPGISKGLWPAFWMRPAQGSLGEIDVMEQIGTGVNPSASEANWINRVSQTIWYDYVGTYPKRNYVFKPQGFNVYDGFHIYAVEWEKGVIRWYVDEQLTYQLTSAEVSWMDEVFSQPFYLRLNMAVGGNWPGTPTEDTAFPSSYEIDYVRVYQRAEVPK